MSILNNIPDWLGAALFAALGWTLKSIFDYFKAKSIPFRQDEERFDEVIAAIDPMTVRYFAEHRYYEDFSGMHTDFLLKSNTDIDLINQFKKNYIKSKLRKLEVEMTSSLDKLCRIIAWESYHKRNTSRTICCDSYNPNDPEQKMQVSALNNDIHNLAMSFNKAYKNYRNYGEKFFATKIGKETT